MAWPSVDRNENRGCGERHIIFFCIGVSERTHARKGSWKVFANLTYMGLKRAVFLDLYCAFADAILELVAQCIYKECTLNQTQRSLFLVNEMC